jgi:hypothetical protein
LTARFVHGRDNGLGRARRAWLVASSRDALRVCLQDPLGAGVKRAELGCLVMSSPITDNTGCRIRAWSDSAQPAERNHLRRPGKGSCR